MFRIADTVDNGWVIWNKQGRDESISRIGIINGLKIGLPGNGIEILLFIQRLVKPGTSSIANGQISDIRNIEFIIDGPKVSKCNLWFVEVILSGVEVLFGDIGFVSCLVQFISL